MANVAKPCVALPDGVLLRRWRPGDEARIPLLLDDRSDNTVWVQQFHCLHGPDLYGDAFRRTVVAADRNDDLIGCTSLIINSVHPQRFPCAIEVMPPY